jgi:chemotaxis protein methyltransferase CheR
MINDIRYEEFYSKSLSKSDFSRLSHFIQSRIGIKMPLSKLNMVEARLRKRLKELKINSYSDYCDYLFSPEGMDKELEKFINVITTNKTDFFREPDHFEFLIRKTVPDLITTNGSGVKKRLTVWSSACSRGNEAYTLAIVLSEFARQYPGLTFDFFILATDISTNVLEKAQRAVYSHDDISVVSYDLRKRYFLRSKDRNQELVRVAPEIRNKVKFRQLNLMDNDFRLREPVDIIFCRNVIIYFDRKTQRDLIIRLCRNLVSDGYLYMGHSEVLDCHGLPLVSVAPAVYKKTDNRSVISG